MESVLCDVVVKNRGTQAGCWSDVAKNRIERNRLTDGRLWNLFVVGGPKHGQEVPGATPQTAAADGAEEQTLL
jgi:hypothetical protein